MRLVSAASVAFLMTTTVACQPASSTATPEEAADPSEPEAIGPQRARGVVHRFSNNFSGGLGCEPIGDERTVIGKLVLRPFKGDNEGALLKTKDDETWVLSYRATGALRRLAGERVLARGRECEKQGEAYAGRHLDLRTLQKL